MRTPVWFWSNRADVSPRRQWDTGTLRRLFEGKVGPLAGTEFACRESTRPDALWGGAAVVVVGGRHHTSATDLEDLNGDLAMLHAVLLVVVGDEEGVFPWREVRHDRIRFWMQMPRRGVHDDMAEWAYFFGNGTDCDIPDRIADRLRGVWPDRTRDWVFMGQATHQRRRQAVDGLSRALRRTHGTLLATEGFTQGVGRDEYLDLLLSAKVSPCPAGPFTQDTFRFSEALEAGCAPILDAEAPRGGADYWGMVRRPPFSVVTDDWSSVGGTIEQLAARYPEPNIKALAWWANEKHDMARRLVDDLAALGGRDRPREQATILITTSPTERLDHLWMIGEVVSSARHWLSDAPIVIAADGVRPEQEHLRAKYLGDLYDIAMMCHHAWGNARLVWDDEWRHQAGTSHSAMAWVDTPTVLALEHDTPLVTDEPIAMPDAVEAVAAGMVDVLRFHHEALVLPEHEYTMCDHHTRRVLDLPIRRTRQWSQRPFLAGSAYYRRILDAHFPPTARTMVEDKMHSVCMTEPWAKNRLAIYHPDGNIKRSHHLDGRGVAPKFDMRYE